MEWKVLLCDDFEPEFLAFDTATQDEIFAASKLLQAYGPSLGRPFVDTLKGSRNRNMKELRLTVNKAEWRVAFAFAPDRNAVLLCAADKRGRSQRVFYERLIAKADARYDDYLSSL
jgi:hypothetical protein